jgi:hypothetical protein
MAIILPAAWPDLVAEGKLDPGLPFDEEDVRDLVEETHYLMSAYGRLHVAQSWPGRLGAADEPTLSPGRVEVTTAGAWVRRLVYPILPRLGTVGLAWLVRCCSDSGCSVQVRCVETGEATSAVLAVGLQLWRGTLTFAAARPETETTIEVSMQRAVAGSYCDLLGFYCYDKEMTAAELPQGA